MRDEVAIRFLARFGSFVGKSLAIVAFGLASGGTQACTFVLDHDSSQCKSDDDCSSYEGNFCNEHHVCRPRADYCFNNNQCIELQGTETYFCNPSNHKCVNLLTKECPKLLADPGDLRNNEAIILGNMGMPSTAADLLAGENGIEMGRQDFRETQGGVPPGREGGQARPVVTIACDLSVLSDTQYKTATDHLIDDVNVPLIFGPLPSDWMSYTFQRALAKGTVLLSASDTAGVTFTNAPGRVGLLFRNNYLSPSAPVAAAKIVETKAEPASRVAHSIPAGGAIKVALVTTGDPTQEPQVASCYDALRFNGGKTPAENGANYLELNNGGTSTPGFDDRLAAVVVQLKTYKPDVVVYFGGKETIDTAIAVENALPGYPTHILGSTALSSRLSEYVGSDTAKQKRFYFSVPGQISTDPAYARWQTRYQAKFPDGGKGPILTLGAFQWDGYYFAMFAIGSLGFGPVTGPAIGQALLHRLEDGPMIGSGPEQIVPTFLRLRSQQNVVYQGAQSTSAFDANGDIVPRSNILCISTDTTLGDRFVETGLYYDPRTQSLMGTNTCFN